MSLNRLRLLILVLICQPTFSVVAQEASEPIEPADNQLDIPPEIIEESPVLQEWLQETPDVLKDIRHDPAFVTRLRLGLVNFPSTDDAWGLNLGVEDIFIKRSGLTISADYQTTFSDEDDDGNIRQRENLGLDLHYFVRPLGSYLNFAPLVGYRSVESNDFDSDGIHLGARVMLAFSRTGAGDISLAQSFINPGGNEEVGITSFTAGYAVTPQLRLAADLERQNSTEDNDSLVGLSLEWIWD